MLQRWCFEEDFRVTSNTWLKALCAAFEHFPAISVSFTTVIVNLQDKVWNGNSTENMFFSSFRDETVAAPDLF